MPRLAPLLALVALALALPAGKAPLVLADVDAQLPEVVSHVRVAGPGVPKQVDLSLETAALAFGAGDTFTLVLDDGAELTGTFTRKGEAARALRLALDAQGEEALIASLGARVVALVAPGAPIAEVTGLLGKVALRVRLVLDGPHGTARAKLAGRFAADLGLDLVGFDDQPLAVRLKLSGESADFPLDLLLGG